MKRKGFAVVFLAALMAACGKGPAGPDPNQPPPPTSGFRITTTQLPAITPLVGYSAQLEATDGQPPYRFSASSVPAGLNVSSEGLVSGMMDGCPGPGAMLSASVSATDSSGAIAPATTVRFPCQYEYLPTGRRYLLDANGAQTHMWVRLLAEPIPARGSTVTLGSGVCNSGGCFHNLSLEYGLDSLPNPATIAGFAIGFSQDGQVMNVRLTGGGVQNGSSVKTDSGLIWPFVDKFKYLVVQASFRGDFYSPGESGTVKLLLDYK